MNDSHTQEGTFGFLVVKENPVGINAYRQCLRPFKNINPLVDQHPEDEASDLRIVPPTPATDVGDDSDAKEHCIAKPRNDKSDDQTKLMAFSGDGEEVFVDLDDPGIDNQEKDIF
ncbi:hypothetical protein PG984_016593 [Apiospora sp. TS-2023a]